MIATGAIVTVVITLFAIVAVFVIFDHVIHHLATKPKDEIVNVIGAFAVGASLSQGNTET
ncbi:hypothetical protein KA405_03255 [Patescibacteria group bacterium]|nr:hypothetical protein [Patescibacteria group bacterium]